MQVAKQLLLEDILIAVADIKSKVLGAEWQNYASVVTKILEEQKFRTYKYLPEDEFTKLLREKTTKGKQVYIDEILFRAHFSAIAALARTHTWCKAILVAERSENYFSLCVALRGLLESSADIDHSFNATVNSLAANLMGISKHYQGEYKNVFPDLRWFENQLIHFMYARKLKKDEKLLFPESHKSEEIKNYIQGISHCAGIEEFYTRLCGISHPAADSICFFESYDEDSGVQSLSWKNEHSIEIKKLCDEYRGCIDFIVSVGHCFPFLMLGVLNEFNNPKVSTIQIQKIGLDWIPRWKILKKSMQQSGGTILLPDNVIAFPS